MKEKIFYRDQKRSLKQQTLKNKVLIFQALDDIEQGQQLWMQIYSEVMKHGNDSASQKPQTLGKKNVRGPLTCIFDEGRGLESDWSALLLKVEMLPYM